MGSAWTGNMLKTGNEKQFSNVNSSLTFDRKLLNLAKKHRMNTDTRRNIFCIIMSAEVSSAVVLLIGMQCVHYITVLFQADERGLNA